MYYYQLEFLSTFAEIPLGWGQPFSIPQPTHKCFAWWLWRVRKQVLLQCKNRKWFIVVRRSLHKQGCF